MDFGNGSPERERKSQKCERIQTKLAEAGRRRRREKFSLEKPVTNFLVGDTNLGQRKGDRYYVEEAAARTARTASFSLNWTI